ncbi:MAG TPA: DegT/DnrJ/EryC1/StrS aminotransferase family protein [Kofleriaceae bacterium]|nr:DegT/DnrJ/EryC1/StrS aminotransferase family protein [Kofleriaceae bacterium]
MIPLARPSLGETELAAAERALRSGRLVLGPENRRFEEELAARCRRRHAVAAASGTAALELALWALDVAPGDQVLVTAFGFPAAANAVVRAGATPVAVDVDRDTWTLDPEAAQRALAGCERPRAIISIDQLGLPAEAAPLERLQAGSDVPVVADAACGLGGVDSSGRPGGGSGRVAVLSFHPRKLITTGEGGAVLCDDDGIAAALRELRNHGQDGPGSFHRAGTNARMSEIAAAIGCAQLARLDEMVAERRLLAEGYRRRLAPLARAGRLSWQEPATGAVHAYQTFAVRLAPGVDRDRVRRVLAAAAIESGPATFAFHRLPPHRRAGQVPLEQADALHDRALALPLYIGMRSAELDAVVDALGEALA